MEEGSARVSYTVVGDDLSEELNQKLKWLRGRLCNVNLIGASGIMVDWSPGNGTNYGILALRLTPLNKHTDHKLSDIYSMSDFGGVSDHGWLIACALTHKMCLIQPKGTLTDDYLADKLELNRGEDSKCIGEIVRAITGREGAWMAEKELRVLVKKVGEAPEVETIPNTLAALQGIVDGYIEAVRFAKGIVLLCNKEGKLESKPLNFRSTSGEIVGDVCFVGADDGEHFISLTEDQIFFIRNMLELLGVLYGVN